MSIVTRRRMLILGLVLAAPLLGGCTQEDVDWIWAKAVAWARSEQLIDDAGNPNYVRITLWYLNPTNDPAARAALDAGRVAQAIEAADQLADQGLTSGDISLIEQAIDRRPDDWSLLEHKGALLLAQGDQAGADQAFAASELLMQAQVELGGNCSRLARNLLTHRQAALEQMLTGGPNQAVQDKLDATSLELNLLQEGQPTLLCP